MVPDYDDHPTYNPNRDAHLFWYTEEGYIIAQDVQCQYDYIDHTPCPQCKGQLKIVAHLNRDGQGLSEMVTVCRKCRYNINFIFDISNEVYQQWWAAQMGSLYMRVFDGQPRQPHSPD